MRHVMRAEYVGEAAADAGVEAEVREPDAGRGEPGEVRSWHMEREGEGVAMCGRRLVPEAATLSDEEWGRTAEPFCHTCGALYLREVP